MKRTLTAAVGTLALALSVGSVQAQYGPPMANPYAQYGQPMANPYAQPMANPYAQYGQPMVNPYALPGAPTTAATMPTWQSSPQVMPVAGGMPQMQMVPVMIMPGLATYGPVESMPAMGPMMQSANQAPMGYNQGQGVAPVQPGQPVMTVSAKPNLPTAVQQPAPAPAAAPVAQPKEENAGMFPNIRRWLNSTPGK